MCIYIYIYIYIHTYIYTHYIHLYPGGRWTKAVPEGKRSLTDLSGTNVVTD